MLVIIELNMDKSVKLAEKTVSARTFRSMKRLYGHDDMSDWDDLPNRGLPHFTNRDILERWDVRRTSSQLADAGPSP